MLLPGELIDATAFLLEGVGVKSDLDAGPARLTVSHYLCPQDLPLTAFLDVAREQGFGGVALTCRSLEEMPAKAIRAELEARDLVVSSVNSAGYFLDAAGEPSAAQQRDNERLLRMTEALGSGALNVIVGSSTRLPLALARPRALEGLRAFARQAAEIGVPLVLEPLNPLHATGRSCLNTISQALAWLDGLPGTMLTVDFFHSWWDPALPDVLTKPAPVGLFQLCDVAIDSHSGLYTRVPLGEGQMEGLAWLPAVREHRPTVLVELELFAQQMPERSALDVLAACAQRLGLGSV
jgi:sugar phosphate isomerase/epimerase